MQRRVTVGLALLRAAGVGALALLLWNPATSRVQRDDAPPLVLLDASLSMAGRGGHWRAALDTARVLAHGGVIWRFGARVTAFDTLPPSDGASRLGPALAAAAGRGGPLVVVTDGAITDLGDLAPDLVRRPQVVALPRPPFFDGFVAAVEGPRRVGADDTVRLSVSYGSAGGARRARGTGRTQLAVTLSARRLAVREVTLPDSGMVVTELTLPPGRLPPGWSALAVRLEGAPDSEPRDDARLFLIEVNPQPAVVLLAAPPDWDTRFLARTLAEVAHVPLTTFVAPEPGGARWRDAVTLAPVPAAAVARAVAAARLVIEAGAPTAFARFTPRGAVLVWPLAQQREGEWYLEPPPASPLAGALAGVVWDSLPPATALTDLAPDTTTTVALTARLARRGPPRPVVVLAERGTARRALLAASGLYRWSLRSGASAEAYRALVAGLADWLLSAGAATHARFAPVAYEVANGLPLAWRWTDAAPPHEVVVTLAGSERRAVDTLRFDAAGHAEQRLAPGVYRYAAADGRERGLVAVDTYSDEWRPAAPGLTSQPGASPGRVAHVALRDRWWLFVLAIAAFAAEWAWRRRQGLP